jgi:hypothetical protein
VGLFSAKRIGSRRLRLLKSVRVRRELWVSQSTFWRAEAALAADNAEAAARLLTA